MRTMLPSRDVVKRPKALDDAHARMRDRDRERIARGEASPRQVQEENSIVGEFQSFELLNLSA